MRSNAGMAKRQGDVDLREAQVSAPQLELWLRFASLGPGHSFLSSSICSFNSTLATSRDTYQEGRNNAGLPGHDASWTGHYTTQQNSLSSSTQPCTCTSCHNTPCISDCSQQRWGRPRVASQLTVLEITLNK